jgi:LacI family transcriptional regulator
MHAIGYRSADFFLARGHRKIFYINLPETMTQSQHRLEGFRLAYQEKGLSFPEKDHFYLAAEMEEAYSLTKKFFAKGASPVYTAIVTASEIQAMGVIRALREAGREIPGDVELLSMGGSVLSTCAVPSLTVMDFNSRRHGAEAAKVLLEILNRKRISPFHMLLPANLIERDSTKKSGV